jgi:DNA polymerase III alpha subunit (gram-positive type)
MNRNEKKSLPNIEKSSIFKNSTFEFVSESNDGRSPLVSITSLGELPLESFSATNFMIQFVRSTENKETTKQEQLQVRFKVAKKTVLSKGTGKVLCCGDRFLFIF